MYMADGPSSPEQPNIAPSQPKFGGLGRLFRRGNQGPAQQQPTETEQPAQLENRFTTIMSELEKKNVELGGYLVDTFGEGETRFMVLDQPLSFSDNRYPSDQYNSDAGSLIHDSLVVTTQGFNILRERVAPLKHDPKFPQYEVVPQYDDEGRAAESAIVYLKARGSARRNDENRAEDVTEGSGYTSDGKRHTFNFGKEHALNFSTVDGNNAYCNSYTPAIKELARRRISAIYSHQSPEAILDSALKTQGRVKLILNPDPQEVAEIMQYNQGEAKRAYDREQEERRQKEEATAQSKEDTRVEVEPDLSVEREARQNQAAEDVLKILEES